MPTTRSNRSSVHSEINAAGSPMVPPLAVNASLTPPTVSTSTPSTSVASSSTTSILTPDIQLILQTVRDLSNPRAFKHWQTYIVNSYSSPCNLLLAQIHVNS